MLKLDDYISEKCGKAIVVSGSARSGTTIIGKIIHTFQDVEYVHEPPMLFSLFGLISEIDENHWRLLYETYLYEEFLMNALAGRSLNCNRADDSSIYHVKSQRWLEERQNKSLRKVDAELLARNSSLSYKMPDVVPFLPLLNEYYPGTRIIMMLREAHDVFSSLLEKGWFKDETLREKNIIWPNRFLKGIRIPFWVDPADDEKWVEMDELHRIAYYYVRVNQPVEKLTDCIKVKYSDLVKDPRETVRSLAKELNITWGEKTDDVLNGVSRKRTTADYSILKNLDPKTREEVEYFSNIS
jgi:hypothetical protein